MPFKRNEGPFLHNLRRPYNEPLSKGLGKDFGGAEKSSSNTGKLKGLRSWYPRVGKKKSESDLRHN